MTQSVELLLDPELDAGVRRQWDRLAALDLPSQARHTGETNCPHVTLTLAQAVPAYLETALKAALTGRLPVPVRLGGLLCFTNPGSDGTGRHVLARAVVPNLELLELQATCARLFEGLPGTSPLLEPGAWSAHVTLGRNLRTAQLQAAIGVLTPTPELLAAGVAVRRWDSQARSVWAVS